MFSPCIILLYLFTLVLAHNDIVISGNQHSYLASFKVPLDIPFTLYWNPVPPGAQTVDLAVVAKPPQRGGWIGLGFNKQLRMIPSTAYISVLPDNSNRAYLAQYDLQGKSSEEVQPNASSLALNRTIEYASDGTVKFSLILPLNGGLQDLVAGDNIKTGFLFAYGPKPSSVTNLPQHDSYATANIALAGTMGESKSNSNRTILVLVHAIMMFLVWLILTPVAVFFVNVNVRRKLFPQDKDSNPKHTGAHSIIMHTAAIIFLIAVLIGIIGIGSRTFIAHFVIGLVVMVMFIIQVILGRLRQLINPTEKPTSSFSVFLKNQKNTIVGIHSWAGRLAWILAVVNIYLGLRIYPLGGNAGVIVWGILLGIGVLLFIAGPLYKFMPNRSENQ